MDTEKKKAASFSGRSLDTHIIYLTYLTSESLKYGLGPDSDRACTVVRGEDNGTTDRLFIL